MQDIIFTFISSWTTYTSIRKACPFSRLPWDKPIRTGSKVVLAIRSRFIHCAWGAFRFSWETNDERVEIISEFGRTAARIPGTDNAIEAKWWKCILIERTNERTSLANIRGKTYRQKLMYFLKLFWRYEGHWPNDGQVLRTLQHLLSIRKVTLHPQHRYHAVLMYPSELGSCLQFLAILHHGIKAGPSRFGTHSLPQAINR